MKIKNRRIYSKDQAYLTKLREEYIIYGGFDTKLEKGCLTVYSTKRKKPKKKDEKRPERRSSEDLTARR